MIDNSVFITLMDLAKAAKESEDFILSLEISDNARLLVANFNARIYAWYNSQHKSKNTFSFRENLKKFFKEIYNISVDCGYSVKIYIDSLMIFENVISTSFDALAYLVNNGFADDEYIIDKVLEMS